MKHTKTDHLLKAIAGGESRSASYVTAMQKGMSNLDSSMRVRDIPLEHIRGNDQNFFEVEDVQALADSIALIGLQQPLVVTEDSVQTDGKQGYLLIAGHRRRKALLELGHETAPCIVMQPAADELEELALIQTNTTSRNLTYSERMEAVKRTEAALVALKKKGYDLPGSMRDRVAEIAQEKAAEVARMKVIDKNLSQPLREYLKADKINASTAYALARLDEDGQAHFAAEIAADRHVNACGVDHYREKAENSDWIKAECPCSYSESAPEYCSCYSQVLTCRRDGKEVACCHECSELNKGGGCKSACWRARNYKPPEQRAAEEAERTAEDAAEREKHLEAWRSFPGSALPERLHKLLREREIDAKSLNSEIQEAYETEDFNFPSWNMIPNEDECDPDEMPSACQVAALCKHLEVSADYLLGLSDTQQAQGAWYRMQDAAPNEGEVVLVATARGDYYRARWGEDGDWYHPDADDMPLDLDVQYWTRNYPEGTR